MDISLRYTIEQLIHLRDSPLVQKPDDLPSIEQWGGVRVDPPTEQNQRKPRTQSNRGDEQLGGNENGSQRPSLFQTRHFSRGSSTVLEDIVLGPPKSSFFSSSRNQHKPTDPSDKSALNPQDDEDILSDRPNTRDRSFKDRDNDRQRDRGGVINGRRGGVEEGEGWTSAKTRKSLGQDEGERWQRNGDRARDRHHKDNELEAGADAATRRNGANKGRFEQPWLREENLNSPRDSDANKTGARGQGWRDRDRRDDRDWSRGGRVPDGRIEEDPEWMDTPATTEKKQVHTQEDFQRWKERMKAGATPAEEKEEPLSEEVSIAKDVVTKETLAPPKSATPLALESGFGKLLGMWDEGKKSEASTPGVAAPKTQAQKAPKSRFAGFFAPQEEPPRPQPEPQLPASPSVDGVNEDKEGFQRILQMLGGTSITPQADMSRQSKASTNGTETFLEGLRDASPDLASLLNQGPGQAQRQPMRTREEKAALVDAALAPRGTSGEPKGFQTIMGVASPDSRQASEYHSQSRPQSERLGNGRFDEPAARSEQPIPPMGLQALLGHQGNQEQPLSRDREFLLNLMQQSIAPQPHIPGPGRRVAEGHTFNLFLDQNAGPKAPPPKPKGLPPGFFDDRPFPESDIPRREPEQHPDLTRRLSHRAPPGFYDDPSISGLHRRNTTDNPPQQLPLHHHQQHQPQISNMGIPYMKPPTAAAPGMPPPLQDRGIAPPPGFGVGNGMRHPPGFAPPGPPVPPGMPPSVGNTPLGHLGIPRGPHTGMYQGQMPPPPPGYFTGPSGAPPPGFPPLPQEGIMGMGPMGGQQQQQQQRRGHFDMFGAGRGGPPGQYGI